MSDVGMMEVIGTVLPPGKAHMGEIANVADEFLDAEHDAIGRALVGKPILAEHEGAEIGKILSYRHDPETKALQIRAQIRGDMFDARVAQNLILDGTIKDLSLGHLFWTETEYGDKGQGVVAVKKPVEVSVCGEGRREGTHIKVVKLDKNSKLGQRRHELENYNPSRTRPLLIKASKKGMSESVTSTAVITPATIELTREMIAKEEALAALKAQLDAANAEKAQLLAERQAELARQEEIMRAAAEEAARAEAARADEARKQLQAVSQSYVDMVDPDQQDKVAKILSDFPEMVGGKPEAMERVSNLIKICASQTELARRQAKEAHDRHMASTYEADARRLADLRMRNAPITASAPAAITVPSTHAVAPPADRFVSSTAPLLVQASTNKRPREDAPSYPPDSIWSNEPIQFKPGYNPRGALSRFAHRHQMEDD